MSKVILLILWAFLIVSCSKISDTTVEIVWKNNSTVVVKWMGVILADLTLLTSAHVVRDDQLVYMVWWEEYIVSKRDTIGDRAILSKKNTQSQWNLNIFPKKVTPGIPVYAEAIRSGSLMTLTGIVTNPSWSIVAYDSLWRIMTLSGIVLTDIVFSPGDSGAGIYTIEWELIDVVHVK